MGKKITTTGSHLVFASLLLATTTPRQPKSQSLPTTPGSQRGHYRALIRSLKAGEHDSFALGVLFLAFLTRVYLRLALTTFFGFNC